MNKKGMTLVELVMVVAILMILILAAIGAINPIGIMNKARDANRKKDLNRIKIAFEDYFNDKGCYPDQSMIDTLENRDSCNSREFAPWLSNWPCAPGTIPYRMIVGSDANCPKWYKVLTKLENDKDKEILTTWEVGSANGAGTSMTVNYGVSSANISIVDVIIDPWCKASGTCYYRDREGNCNSLGKSESCSSPNCYLGDCQERCRVSYCDRNSY